MKSAHRLLFQDARCLDNLDAHSIDLVVTSPPYPMIEMWDTVFADQDPRIGEALKTGDGWGAYEFMHELLDEVWRSVCRTLKPGGFVCVNIGDAVRKIDESFCLYPNHSRILHALTQNGLSPLPAIIWRKQTNAPNKFMGSGMLPAGAYVTLEHEYILICRKGQKREFKTSEERLKRQQSAIFWEERNQWFSDIWFDLKGARQQLMADKIRKRSGAYPFELPYRLINMYSVMGDSVLDPFAGTGTTMFAAMTAARNSVGIEIEPEFLSAIEGKILEMKDFANAIISDRINRHVAFAAERETSHGPLKYSNTHYGFPVMTNQEKQLRLNPLKRIEKPEKGLFTVDYAVDQEASGPLKGAPRATTLIQQSLFGDWDQ